MTTYYVSSEIGNNNNAGTSATAPLATLRDAANLVKPGDTVEVMNGTYTGSGGGDVLDITTSGTASAPITFEAAPGQNPVINSSGSWNGINIQASYIVVSGFTVVGDAANYTLSQALAGYSTGNAALDGNGIIVKPSSSVPLPNHITIANNTVYNEPGGGIGSDGADYLQILNNVVHDNAHWSAYGNSGITVNTSKNLDTNPGAHSIISGNVAFNNAQLVPTIGTSVISDGEGIILDTNSGYTGQILVQNNTSYNNGGPGIESYLTNNAVITGNTVYGNNTNNNNGAATDSIFINQSNNNTVTNNTFTAPGGSTGGSTGGTTTPATPTISGFSPDTGVVGDGITNANQLDLKGTADPNSTITVYDGSTKLGTTTATSTGSWDYITSILTDAKHVLTATETSASGQTSAASAPLTVTVDTHVPAAPVLVSDPVVNTNQVQLSGTAEANSTITVYDGTTVVGTGTTSSTSAWSITTSALSSGTHALTATATDVAGTVSAMSQPLDPVISAPPAAPTIASFSPDTGVVGDHITNDNTPTLTGTAVANSAVAVFDGTTKIGSATTNASGQWTLTTPALSDGTHALTATDTVSGQTSAASSAFSVTIDTQAPATPTLAAFSQAGSAVGSSTTLTDLVLKGTAAAGSTIKVDDGATQIGTANTGSTGAWSFDTGTIALGSHSFTATATDIAGNTSAASAADAVTVVAPPPVAPTPTPPAAPTGLADAAIVNGYVNAAQDTTTQQLTGSAEAGSTVSVYDGTSNLGTVTAASNGSWSYTLGHLADGSHSLTATATDAAGTSAASASLAFTVDTQAPATPTLAAYSQAGSAVGSSTTLTDLVLKGSAAAGSTIKVDDGTTQIGTANTGSTGAWSFDTGTIALGSHSFTATATDIAGNTSAASAVDAVTITSTTTSTTPVAPTLTVASNSLYVSPGGRIPLGLGVNVPSAGDNVTVNISGLPKYETITDNLDHKTFSGNSVTLTAAEVNSGLTLNNSYHGHGRPTATMTATATDTTGTPITSRAQTITVVDPPATTTSSGPSPTTSNTSTTTSGDGRSWGQSHHHLDVAQWFNSHPDFAHVATTLSEAGATRSGAVSSPATRTTAYALLNQMMAGDFGRESHFAQAATALSALPQQQASLLTRPLH
jgi:hypothetical protein